MADPQNSKLRFDPVVTWGHILVAFTVLFSGVALYASNEVRYTDLNLRVRVIENALLDYRVEAKEMNARLQAILIEISQIKANIGIRGRIIENDE